VDAAQVADTFGAMAAIAIAVVALAAAVGAVHAPTRELVRDTVDQHGATSAWLVAAIAMGGSLWFSEAANFPPCQLCWYQRIAMYPLVIILAVGAARRDGAAAVYALALALVGGLIALYHTALEWFPALDAGACSATTPCTLVWFRTFGVISLPVLALTAFALIAVILLIRIRHPDHRSDRS